VAAQPAHAPPTQLSPDGQATQAEPAVPHVPAEAARQTPSASQGNLVGDHMYMITGVNAASDTLTIRNPWGSSYSGSLAMTFTESIQQLAADNTSLWVTSGKAV